MKIFFSDYEADEHVSAEAPREVSLQDALAQFEALSDEEGCFFGIIDDKEQTLQFMYNDDGTLLIDVPLLELEGSLKRDSTSFEECRQLILDSERGIQVKRIPDMTFEPW